ncbi:MAG: tyrosine-type recombinase/integrase [Deltaproteobacteria bacterium]|nr:tyrosine-type recombinase/integrase [Deltaproteobacteria bacterium]
MRRQKTMVAQVKEYVSYRRHLGFQLRIEEGQLLNFARYADKSGHQGPVTTELILRWARLPEKASPLYQARRVEVVRCFTKYQSIFSPKTEIPPPRILGSAHRRTEPYIYSQPQISALLKACADLLPVEGLRPRTYAALLGLIACTGLRISEALKLSRDDVDLTDGRILIRETKFHKSRFVSLHPSATKALQKYAQFRDQYHQVSKSKHFFVSETGLPLPYSTVNETFQSLRERLGWNAENIRRPRIQDMRHTFACRRLLLWYEHGRDVNHAIYSLSTYLGHAKVTDTYWYLTGIPELFAVVGDKFENYALKEKEG